MSEVARIAGLGPADAIAAGAIPVDETNAEGGSLRRVAFLGSHIPRQCGIATFTADISSAVHHLSPDIDTLVVAVNDPGKEYTYPEQVRYQVFEASLASYRKAADYLNVSDVDILSLQHEYGIFGGKEGAHVLTLLRALRIPVVTTLHTVLAVPNAAQRAVMDEICTLSERLVVMSHGGAALLRSVHAVPEHKIEVIPHGIPALPSAPKSKRQLGLSFKRVLLTFGLLSPDKGIETVIDALVSIIEHFPDVVYVVLGATHPHVRERHGEAYRLMLEARCRRLGVDGNVVFHDRFVSNAELAQFLAAADIYITPYLNTEQITSGTLAYAVGSGKAVISSPYRYSEELLAEGRGVIVPAKDAAALAAQVVDILGDPERKAELERRAAVLGETMGWPVVARHYLKTLSGAREQFQARTRSTSAALRLVKGPELLPEINLAHLQAMTDDTGMLQHAIWSIPRYEDGYCVDDNARALLLVTMIEETRIEPPAEIRRLANRYLAFVRHAFNPENGRFRNFMSFARHWTEAQGSEDSHGRTIWALGTTIARTEDPGRRELASSLFHASLSATLEFTSPRAWAYTLLGVHECLHSNGHDESLQAIGRSLAERLLALYRRCSGVNWSWFEDRVTYCNARLPQALMLSGLWLEDEEMVASGLSSLAWLVSCQETKTHLFAPIGSNGFFDRGGIKAAFDQQPVEACGVVSATLLAHRITGDEEWLKRAQQAFDWFLGVNQLDQWLYDASTGGCRDGLHAERANENQGAEATLSFLMALMEMRQRDRRMDWQGVSTSRGVLNAVPLSRRLQPAAASPCRELEQEL